jgi:hypothetical protein
MRNNNAGIWIHYGNINDGSFWHFELTYEALWDLKETPIKPPNP